MMYMVTKSSQFGIMCRSLRKAKRLKLREVAQVLGIANSTAGNLESCAFKVVSRDKAMRLAAFYELHAKDLADFISAWEAWPLSQHGKKRREYWAKQNERRSKAKNHDPLKLALVELLGLHIMALPEAEVCACDFDIQCGVCGALDRIGIDPFTPADRDKILARLGKVQQELLTKMTPSAHDTNSLAR